MRSFNKYILGLLLGGCIFASVAEERNTFTITITGPEEQSAQQTQTPARATPQRAQRPARQAAATPAPRPVAQAPERLTVAAVPPAVNQAQATTNYTVKPQDTIWSIASRFTPVNSNVTEFQTIASIYRNNPEAFANGNINNLRRGTLKIPSVADIARESSATGAQLLRNGTMTLPPLAAAVTPAKAAPAVPAAPAINRQEVTNAINEAVAAATGKNTQTPTPADSEPKIDNTKSSHFDIPVYVARETKLREMNAKLDDPSKNYYSDDDGSVGDTEGTTVNADNDPAKANIDRSQYKDAKPLEGSELDLVAVKTMLETTQQQFAKANEKLDQKIDQSVLRAETVAKSSASSIAKDEVVKALSHYEGVIANLQQSNAELRASISKFNKQVDQVRAISISNADKLSQLESQYIGMTESGDESIPQGPMMWILLGVGVLCLVLAISFFLLKGRKTNNDNNDDYSMDADDDLSSEMLITSGIVNKADLHAAEEEEYAVKAGVSKDDGVSSNKDSAPKDPNLNSVDRTKQEIKDAYDDQLIVPTNFNGEDEMPPQEDDKDLSDHEREAQRAWEEAAKKKAEAAASKKKQLAPAEDDVMAAWSASLNAESDDKSTVVDVAEDDSSNKNIIREEDQVLTSEPNDAAQDKSSEPPQTQEPQQTAVSDDDEDDGEVIETLDTYNDPSTSIDDGDIKAVSDESQLGSHNTSEQEQALANAWVSSLSDDSKESGNAKAALDSADITASKSNAPDGTGKDLDGLNGDDERAMADAWAASLNDNDTALEIDTKNDEQVDETPKATDTKANLISDQHKSTASDEEQAMTQAWAAALNAPRESLEDTAQKAFDRADESVLDVNSAHDEDSERKFYGTHSDTYDDAQHDDEIVMSSLDDLNSQDHTDYGMGHDLSLEDDVPASAEEQELMEKMAKSMSSRVADADKAGEAHEAQDSSGHADTDSEHVDPDNLKLDDDLFESKTQDSPFETKFENNPFDETDNAHDVKKGMDTENESKEADTSPAMSDEDIARALKQRSDELMYPQPKDAEDHSSIFDKVQSALEGDSSKIEPPAQDNVQVPQTDHLSDIIQDDSTDTDAASANDESLKDDELSLDDIVGTDESIDDMHSSHDMFATDEDHDLKGHESVDDALARLESNERSEDFGDLHKAFAHDADEHKDHEEELPLDATSLQNSLNGTPDKVHVIGDDLDFGSLLNQDVEHAKDDTSTSEMVPESNDNDDEDDFDLEVEDDKDTAADSLPDADAHEDTSLDGIVDPDVMVENETEDKSVKSGKNSDVSWEVPDSDFDVTEHEDKIHDKDHDSSESVSSKDPIEKAIDSDRDMLESMLAGDEIQRDPITGDEILSADGISSRDIANMLKENDDESTVKEASLDDIVDPESADNLENTALSSHFDDDTGNIEHEQADNSGIDSRLHQKLTDELNLAQLFFETGDTDDALAIVEKVKKQGSPDLIQIAEDLKSRYADN